jgi:hypothetical protein
MSDLESRELFRQQYSPGQTLRSFDFRDQRRVEQQLRAWHNRAFHNVYGIAKDILDGLTVNIVETAPGIKSARVNSGLAYDCFGRELLLLNQVSIPFGIQNEAMVLVLSHKYTSASCGSNNNACVPFPALSRAARTELVWIAAKRFSFQDGVALARTKVTATPTSKDVSIDDTFVRLAARPLSRPRIGTGSTIPGATTWERWDISVPTGPFIGLQVRFDVSSAGFSTTPEFFASLQGGLTNVDAGGALRTACVHFDHIDEVRADSFVFRTLILVITVSKTLEFEKQVQKFLQDQKAYVSWIGLERSADDQTR